MIDVEVYRRRDVLGISTGFNKAMYSGLEHETSLIELATVSENRATS